MENSSVLDGENLEFLEKTNGNFPRGEKMFDPAILQEAPKYGIDLAALEDIRTEQTVPAPAAVIRSAVKPVARTEEVPAYDSVFLDQADVPLRDVVEKIFRRAERPFVIVRDDRIEYVNQAFLKLLDIADEREILQEKFLKLVSREDWDYLAANIGEMLTNNKIMEIKLVSTSHKIVKMKFEALYLSDNQHFTFILAGERPAVRGLPAAGMYDPVTGLPNFYLFEDRVQVAVNYENYKDMRQKKNMIAVCGISIDNFAAFQSIGMQGLVLRKLAEKLVLSLRKTYTVASGLKYQFWILLPDVMDEETLKIEVRKIKAVVSEPVADNFTSHEVKASVGVSVFPEPATSAKKLIEQSILAIQKAQRTSDQEVVIFGA